MTNLLVNGEFRAEWQKPTEPDVLVIHEKYIEWKIIDNIHVLPRWLAYTYDFGDYHQIEMRDTRTADRLFDGHKANLSFCWGKANRSGMMQTVHVEPGIYRLRGWAHSWSNHPIPGTQVGGPYHFCVHQAGCSMGVGFEPFFALEGAIAECPDLKPDGTPYTQAEKSWRDGRLNMTFRLGVVVSSWSDAADPRAANVEWGQGAHIYNAYHEVPEVVVEITEECDVTVLVESTARYQFENGDSYWGKVLFERIGDVTPPEPMEPKRKYEREVHVLPQNATEEEIAEVLAIAVPLKNSVMFSLDDAMIDHTYLTRRKVHVWAADRIAGSREALEAWGWEYYSPLPELIYHEFGATPEPPTPAMPHSKLGAHVLADGPDIDEYIQTGVVTKLAGSWGKSEMANPGQLVIGRVVHKSWDAQSQYTAGMTPAEAVQELFDCDGDIYEANPRIRYWEGHNEPVWEAGGKPDPVGMAWYTEFEIERMRRAEQDGRRCVIGNFATGTPPLELWEYFLPACEYARDHGHLLGLHEYSCPWMWWMTGSHQVNPEEDEGDEGWTTLRYRKVYRQWLEPFGIGDLRLVITECGLDPNVNPKPDDCGEGGTWQGLGNYWAEHDQQTDKAAYYAEQLRWYDEQLQQDDYVVGATVFTWGNMGEPWSDYDVAGTQVARSLIALARELPPLPFEEEPVEPEPDPDPEPPTVPLLLGFNAPAAADEAGRWLHDNCGGGLVYRPVFLGTSPQTINWPYEDVRLIVNLRYSWSTDCGGQGTLPVTKDATAFINAAVETIARSSGVWGWTIGNEFNNPREWPVGNELTPEYVSEIYNEILIRVAESVRVAPGAIDPYNAESYLDPREWMEHIWADVDGADFVDVHGYVRGPDASLIGSEAKFEHAPMQWQYLNVPGCFTTLLGELPGWAKDLPVVLSEFNHIWKTVEGDWGWVNDLRAGDVVHKAAEMARDCGLMGLMLYRWTGDEWATKDNQFVLNELKWQSFPG